MNTLLSPNWTTLASRPLLRQPPSPPSVKFSPLLSTYKQHSYFSKSQSSISSPKVLQISPPQRFSLASKFYSTCVAAYLSNVMAVLVLLFNHYFTHNFPSTSASSPITCLCTSHRAVYIINSTNIWCLALI